MITMCLDGIDYESWYISITTLRHGKINTFEDFNKRVLDRFEHKYIEEYFKDLEMLQHTTTVDAYIEKFQRIVVSIPNIEDWMLAYLFMYRLQEPIRSSVKAMDSSTLSMVICNVNLLEGFSYPKGVFTNTPSTWIHTTSINKESTRRKPPPLIQIPANRLDYAIWEAFRKQKLCIIYWNT